MRGTGRTALREMSGARHLVARSGIHVVGRPGRPLLEIPMATTPYLRFPYYHTLQHLAPSVMLRETYASLLRARRPLSYVLHAVDALGLHEDGVDARMARHPGMKRPLHDKLALIERVFAMLKGDWEIRLMREATAR
jgi:hypothetical protein